MRNKVTIQITGIPDSSIPTEILLQRLCLLRKAKAIGDVETVNMTQLGRLNDYQIKYTKLI